MPVIDRWAWKVNGLLPDANGRAYWVLPLMKQRYIHPAWSCYRRTV